VEEKLRQLLTAGAALMQRRRQADEDRAGGRLDDRQHADLTRRLDRDLADRRKQIKALRQRIARAATEVKAEFDTCRQHLAEIHQRPQTSPPSGEAVRLEAELLARQKLLAERFRHLRALWKAQSPADLPDAAEAATDGEAASTLAVASVKPEPPIEAGPEPAEPQSAGPATLEPLTPAAGQTDAPAPVDEIPLTPLDGEVCLVAVEPPPPVPLTPVDEPLLTPLDAPPGGADGGVPLTALDDAVPLKPLRARWMTPGRILVIVAASLLLLASMMTWLSIPLAARATEMAESAFEGVSALLGESADVDAMPGKPRFLAGAPRAGSAVLALLATGLLFVPSRTARGAAWWLAGSAALTLLVLAVWDHRLRMLAWGALGSGIGVGAYVGTLALAALMVAGGIAAWPGRRFRRLAALAPAAAVLLAAFLFTNAFGIMADRLTVSIGEPEAQKSFGAPVVRTTMVVDNTGWNMARLYPADPNAARPDDGFVVRLSRQAGDDWRVADARRFLPAPMELSLTRMLKDAGRGRPSGHPVAPGEKCALPLTFQPAWNPGPGIANSAAGRWRIELCAPGDDDPIEQVTIDVPGRDHPDVVYRKQLAEVRRVLAAGGAEAAREAFKKLSAPSWGAARETRAAHQALGAEIWKALAEAAAARLDKIPQGQPIPADLARQVAELTGAREAYQSANSALVARLRARQREAQQLIYAQRQKQAQIEAAKRAITGGDPRRVISAVKSFQQRFPGDPEAAKLTQLLHEKAPSMADQAIEAKRFSDAWALLTLPGLAEPGSDGAKAWARRARSCAVGLAGSRYTAATASAAFDLAEKLDPALAADAEFAWDRLRSPGAKVTAEQYRAFVGRFPSHPMADKARMALLAALGRKVLQPATAVTAAELDELIAMCGKAASSPSPAVRGTGQLLCDIARLRRATSAARADEPAVLKMMNGLYRRLATIPEAAGPGGGDVPPVGRQDVLAALLAARKPIGWGKSLGEAMDGEEVRMTLRLNPAVIRSRATAGEAIGNRAAHKLLIVRCSQADVSAAQVSSLQKWAIAGGTLWIMNTDMLYNFGFPRTGCRPITSPLRATVEPVEDPKGANARLIEGLPANLGLYTLGVPCYGLSTEARGSYVNVLRVRQGRRTGCFVSLTRFGKGAAVLISLPIDRDRLGVSRLIHNLKRHACDLAKGAAATGP